MSLVYNRSIVVCIMLKAVIIPGFLGYKEETHLIELKHELEKIGIDNYIFDWTSFPLDPLKYSVSNALNSFRRKMDRIKDEEIILIGFSLGGVISTILAIEFNVKILGLVSSSFQFTNGDIMQGVEPLWKKAGHYVHKSSRYGVVDLPYSFVEDARSYNALEYITKVESFKFFIAGTEDHMVPPSISYELFKKAGEPKEWVLIEGMEHKYKKQAGFISIVDQKILESINKGLDL